jgi:hypothetical protein
MTTNMQNTSNSIGMRQFAPNLTNNGMQQTQVPEGT